MLSLKKQKTVNFFRLIFTLKIQNNMMIGKMLLNRVQLQILNGLFIQLKINTKNQECVEIVAMQQYLFIYC